MPAYLYASRCAPAPFCVRLPCLQAMLKECCTICDLVLELIVQFACKLQHELFENEFRWDAVHQQLIQLAPDCKQALGSLLCKDIIGNFLHGQTKAMSSCKVAVQTGHVYTSSLMLFCTGKSYYLLSCQHHTNRFAQLAIHPAQLSCIMWPYSTAAKAPRATARRLKISRQTTSCVQPEYKAPNLSSALADHL